MSDPHGLRSREWFAGTDEVAVMHRVALRNVGIHIDRTDGRPVIGIADSSATLNPCNAPLRALADEVAAGVTAAGGIPVIFPVMSLGEDLMKPTAMLYRNLLAMEVEEYARANPIDGLVLLGNCDKSIPGALMGAISINLPTLVVNAGARPAGVFHGRRVGTGTDLWRAWDDRRAGVLDDAGWAGFERALSCGAGACNTMGTASSMAIVTEVLGMMLPGTSTIPAGTPERTAAAFDTGQSIVVAVADDVRPQDVLTVQAFRRAVVALNAIGGSTNVVIHLLALAGRTGAELALDDFDELARTTPILADIEPAGRGLIQDFHAAGGVPALLRELGDLIDDVPAGRPRVDVPVDVPVDLPSESPTESLAESPVESLVESPAAEHTDVIRSRLNPLSESGTFAVLRGSLAPTGALVKVSSCTPRLLQHTGPALVFRDYDRMIAALDDPDLDVNESTVIVFAGGGPVGAPGMPEWGMIPIPRALAERGVRDVVRISDARMSGTSFGTCVVHVTPEAAVGGPLAHVRTGDPITVDLANRRLDVRIAPAELERRRELWRAPQSRHLRGWPLLYQRHVMQADTGCDFDFLTAETPQKRAVINPTIGRS